MGKPEGVPAWIWEEVRCDGVRYRLRLRLRGVKARTARWQKRRKLFRRWPSRFSKSRRHLPLWEARHERFGKRRAAY
jgi:hypothetical protein